MRFHLAGKSSDSFIVAFILFSGAKDSHFCGTGRRRRVSTALRGPSIRRPSGGNNCAAPCAFPEIKPTDGYGFSVWTTFCAGLFYILMHISVIYFTVENFSAVSIKEFPVF
jgi:hypothetical protein